MAGWWMSEKLDGVRTYRDGTGFVSGLCNRYSAPDWFLAGLPPEPFDGELWCGHKLFQQTVRTVRRQDAGEAWRDVAFVVFDLPALDAPLEERVACFGQRLDPQAKPYARVHEHVPCRDLDHLRSARTVRLRPRCSSMPPRLSAMPKN